MEINIDIPVKTKLLFAIKFGDRHIIFETGVIYWIRVWSDNYWATINIDDGCNFTLSELERIALYKIEKILSGEIIDYTIL